MNRSRSPVARLRTLGTERRGVALIEFAFAAPVLLLLFVGGYQLMDAISAYRKVTTTVRALADLTTQSTSLTSTGADQILAASTQIMAPYPAGTAQMRITQFKIDNNGNATVDWSRAAGNITPYTRGASPTTPLPGQLVQNNTWLIYSEITYPYVPNVASKLIGTIKLGDTLYMAPRQSASIPCPDC